LTLGKTPSQTVGPYFAIGLPWDDGPFAVAEGTAGAIRISGKVLDGAGTPIPDALVETWQPRPAGFARCPTDDEGGWFVVVSPPDPVGGQAPHVAVNLLARGLLHRVVTRIYFADLVDANAADLVLRSVPADRRDTLLAKRTEHGYRFDIRIQGPDETVFFDV